MFGFATGFNVLAKVKVALGVHVMKTGAIAAPSRVTWSPSTIVLSGPALIIGTGLIRMFTVFDLTQPLSVAVTVYAAFAVTVATGLLIPGFDKPAVGVQAKEAPVPLVDASIGTGCAEHTAVSLLVVNTRLSVNPTVTVFVSVPQKASLTVIVLGPCVKPVNKLDDWNAPPLIL